MNPSQGAPQGPSPSPGTPDPDNDPRGVPFDISNLATAQDDDKKSKWNLKWVALAGVLAAWCLFFWAYGLGVRAQRPMPLGPVKSQSNAPNSIRVYVEGAVFNPGVYALAPESRVSDALAIAGGATPEADPSSLNLAAYVQDGSKISVPRRLTVISTTPPIVSISPPPTTPALSPTSPGGAAPVPPPITSPAMSGTTKAANSSFLRANPIDLNTATSDQLQQLPGVGPAMAERIITYRTINGRFKSVSDLDNVQGIGEKRMESLKDLVIVR